MDWLKSLYPKVGQILQNAAPEYWPDLEPLLHPLYEDQIMPPAILPLAACRAVDGRPGDAVYVSAALIAAQAMLRIVDDLGDRDRPDQLWRRVGQGRAWNYASALQALSFDILSKAPFSPGVFHRVNQLFIDAYLLILAGQDRDMAGTMRSVEDYWTTIEWKTASAYAAPCMAGAIVGTVDPELINACQLYGHHVGLAVQFFNDIESIWLPEGLTDLQQGKFTLPLIYGLLLDHPGREELLDLVEGQRLAIHADRVGEILEQIDIKSFLIWAALKERDEALEAIAICPNVQGREALTSFVTGFFGDIDELLAARRRNPWDTKGEKLGGDSLFQR